MTATLTRDEAISVLEGIAEEALDELNESCADCREALTGFCDDHEDAQARVDAVQPVLRRLYDAGTDEQARAIMAEAFSLTVVTAGTAAAA
jgi:hypothetical protein